MAWFLFCIHGMFNFDEGDTLMKKMILVSILGSGSFQTPLVVFKFGEGVSRASFKKLAEGGGFQVYLDSHAKILRGLHGTQIFVSSVSEGAAMLLQSPGTSLTLGG